MKTILVIDDDQSFRLAVTATLRRRGYDVLGANDGPEGLALAFANRPHLILSDVNMAGATGLEVLNELRTHPETAAIPVIIMTGEPQQADARRSMAQGADDYLPKPFAMEEMLTAVGARLQRQEGITQFIASQHQAELSDTEEKLRLQTSALEAAANGIAITHRDGRILWVNAAFSKLTGYAFEEVCGQTPAILNSGRHQPEFYAAMWRTIKAGNVWHGELVNRRKDGTCYDEEMTITPVMNAEREVQNFVAIKQDITERKNAEKERQMMELQLRQSHKLESIGQLAAGIAHEINTPTQYVGDNTRFVKDSFAALIKILRSHETLLAAARAGTVTPELLASVEQILVDADWEYLCEQIPAALNETLEGVERVSKIVRAMKEFSHPGGQEKTSADLNKAIEGTATVARNEWKYVADLKLELEPNLPFAPCFLGEFNQAILNLIVNAAHAIGDVVKHTPGSKGLICLQTRRDGDHVEVRVTDTGTGIPEAARSKIFEPFFTTKDVGKGTGQGLAMIYGSIVKRHGGTAAFETEVGRGTTFILRLPLKGAVAAEEKPSIPPEAAAT